MAAIRMTAAQVQALTGKPVKRKKAKAPAVPEPNPLPIATGPLRFEVPIPPTTNHLYPTNRHTGKRFKSPEYVAWIEEADKSLLPVALVQFCVPVEVVLTFEGDAGFAASRDGDNCEKALFDTLVRNRIVEDDTLQYIPRHTTQYIERTDPNQPARCWVEITEYIRGETR